MKLREVYERFHRSSAHARTTLQEFNTFLDWWERLTPDPPVAEIDRLALKGFADAALSLHRLRTRHPYSRFTVTKWIACASAILHAAEEHELIERVPKRPRLRCPRRQIVYATPEEVGRIYEQRHVAIWPQPRKTGVPTALWWGTAIVMLYNCGSRLGEWWRSMPLSAVNLEQRLLVLIDHKDGGEIELKAINGTLAAHLRTFIAANPDREMLFPSAYNPRLLYREWHRIQAAAGIHVTRPAWSEQKPYFGFHELRKSCATALCQLNPYAAQGQLGHRSLKTTLSHYAAVAETVRRATDALAQPAAFGELDEPPPGPFRIVG